MASLASHAISAWGWSLDRAINTPITAMIMANRHERRLISKKGFGWAQLDGLEEMKRNE